MHSNATTLSKPHTPDDLLRPPDDKLYELINGELVEKETTMVSNWVTGQLLFEINGYLRQHPIGYAAAEQPIVCFPWSPNHGRRPDMLFIRKEKLPDGMGYGNLLVPPDLAVEVVSPSNDYFDMDAKVDEYLRAGVAVVWVINPALRHVHVYWADGTVKLVKTHESLDGGDVLPGLSVPVTSIFPADTNPAK